MNAKIVFMFCLHLLCLKHTFAQCMNAMMPELVNTMAMTNAMPGQFGGQYAMPGQFNGQFGMPGQCASQIPMPGQFTGQLAMQMPFLPEPSFSIFADGLVVDGLVSVTGSMPFLGTVTLGGTLPANGQGSVLYTCGDGQVGIYSEMPVAPQSEVPAVRSMPTAWNPAVCNY